MLLDALRPFVSSVSWLKYGEDLVKSPLQQEVLTAHKEMLASLHKLSPNLSFTKKAVEEVLQLLATEKGFEVLSTEELTQDWVVTNAKRLRCACRHVGQALLKKPQPKWLALIVASLPASPDAMGSTPEPADPGDVHQPGQGAEPGVQHAPASAQGNSAADGAEHGEPAGLEQQAGHKALQLDKLKPTKNMFGGLGGQECKWV